MRLNGRPPVGFSSAVEKYDKATGQDCRCWKAKQAGYDQTGGGSILDWGWSAHEARYMRLNGRSLEWRGIQGRKMRLNGRAQIAVGADGPGELRLNGRQ